MWRDQATQKSWNLLQRLAQEFPFVLIGGWAVYLYAQRLKSKDIDIIVDLGILDRLKTAHDIRKNARLRKYEFTVDGVDVDTYVPYYSDLGLLPEDVAQDPRSLGGFRVPRPEALLITKQKAEADREGSEKGLKDRIDILSLLLFTDVDLAEYARLLARHGMDSYLERLRSVVSQARTELSELGVTDPGRAKKLRRNILARIDRVRSNLGLRQA